MARRRRKPIRIDAAVVERCLDTLAEIMDRAGNRAHLAVPLWKRLESELARLREDEAVVEAARARLRQSPDRMEAQSG